MKNVEQRRIVPISAFVVVCLSLLGSFQVAVVAGGLKVPARTVKRLAPWAHNAFLHVVGEHPDSPIILKKAQIGTTGMSPKGIATVAGYSPEELEVSLDMKVDAPSTNTVIEPTVPVPEPEKEELKEDPDGDEPVG